MNKSEHNRLALAVVLALSGVCGCSLPKVGDWKAPKMFSLDSTWPWNDDEPKPQVPTRVVGMWTDTVLHKAGEKPQRGFGGRLLFYGEDDKPVMVDGALVVYAFDETGRATTDTKPTRRYVFPADQVALHQSESPVGPSYSFWLPWDEVGGPKTEVSLICRFQPRDGALVMSEQTSHLLPGITPIAGAVAGHTAPKLPEGVPSRPALPQLTLTGQTAESPAPGGAQLVNYEVATPAVPQNLPANASPAADSTANVNRTRQMTTTSIPLPRDFEFPHGSPHISSGTFDSVRHSTQAVPQQATPTSGQQVTPAGIPAAHPALGATNAYGSPQFGSATYQPQHRLTSPAIYQPTYAPSPSIVGAPQTLHPPAASPFGSPGFIPPPGPLPPAQVMQQMQAQYQQQLQAQQTNALPTQTSPQMAQQPMQNPGQGTATVTYR